MARHSCYMPDFGEERLSASFLSTCSRITSRYFEAVSSAGTLKIRELIEEGRRY